MLVVVVAREAQLEEGRPRGGEEPLLRQVDAVVAGPDDHEVTAGLLEQLLDAVLTQGQTGRRVLPSEMPPSIDHALEQVSHDGVDGVRALDLVDLLGRHAFPAQHVFLVPDWRRAPREIPQHGMVAAWGAGGDEAHFARPAEAEEEVLDFRNQDVVPDPSKLGGRVDWPGAASAQRRHREGEWGCSARADVQEEPLWQGELHRVRRDVET